MSRSLRIAATFALALLLAGATGCSTFPWARRPASPASPIVFQTPPDGARIVESLNRNASKIRSIQADNVTISTAGMPSLRGSFVLERPRSLRLRASVLGLSATEIDVGSNQNFFWAAVPEMGAPPTMYYLRQAELADPQAQAALTAHPDWLLEALGLLELDPTVPYQGPYERAGGTIEIRSRTPFAGMQAIRVLAVHPRYGWLEESAYYTPEGKLLAKAVASQHRYDPATETTLPSRIQVEVPAYALSAQMNVGSYAVNRATGDPAAVFTLPQLPGANYVDIFEQMRRQMQMQPASAFSRLDPALPPAYATEGYRTDGYRQGTRRPAADVERRQAEVARLTEGLRGGELR
jgi:hypothetical protein